MMILKSFILLVFLIEINLSYRLENDVVILNAISDDHSSMSQSQTEYFKRRNLLIQSEIKLSLGNKIELTSKERLVNESFINMKKMFYNEKSFYPKELFTFVKEKIHSSQFSKAIEMLPKGATLHVHEFSMYSADWIIQNVTYRPNLYYCPHNQPVLFKFSKSKPHDSKCIWRRIADDRQLSKNQSAFDLSLKRHFILTRDDLKHDQTEIWIRFLGIFDTVKFLLAEDIFQDYIYHGLKRFYDDNVQYMEIRFGLLKLYDMNGKEYPVEHTIETFIKVAKQFVQEHPDFLMPKLIMYSIKQESREEVASDLKQVQLLMLEYPDTIIGYDLVGPENSLHSLLYYIEDLLPAIQTTLPINMRYFFHAGETDWMGTPVDDNLYDAILLNSTRLGHAYALVKHPILYEKVKQKQIALEINPISNQMLGLVRDMRNHPAAILFADNAPLVISSDDPAMWEAKPLSDDFFMALVALGGERADLSTAKQLALNSIKFSVLSDKERQKLTQIWENKWKTFINNFKMF